METGRLDDSSNLFYIQEHTNKIDQIRTHKNKDKVSGFYDSFFMKPAHPNLYIQENKEN